MCFFLAADCDEDESLVKSYLEADKFSMPVVFADGLDRFFTVNAFPTVVVIDRRGEDCLPLGWLRSRFF